MLVASHSSYLNPGLSASEGWTFSFPYHHVYVRASDYLTEDTALDSTRLISNGFGEGALVLVICSNRNSDAASVLTMVIVLMFHS